MSPQRPYAEMRYHLLMIRARLHAVADPVARKSIAHRLDNLEEFIRYLQAETFVTRDAPDETRPL